MERLLAGARAGSGGAVVLEGPAGIGKSSLLAAARTAAAPELRVLSARGGELERELPFGIVRQLLEPVVATDPAEREVLLAGAAALAQPVLSESDPETGSEASFSALHGLYWLTVNLAGSQPVLVTVDDAHWADVASLRWLIYLARRLAGVPLALVLATRPADPGPVQELHDELLVIPEIAVLQPGGLSEQAITMLASQSLAADPDPAFVTACQLATGGNPFLLLELFGELGAARNHAESRERRPGRPAELARRRPIGARPPQTAAIRLHRPRSRCGRARRVCRTDTRSTARRPRRRRSRPRRRRARRGVDLRSRPAARLRPYARALECLLRDELSRACPKPRARRPPSGRCGRSTRSDCRTPVGDPPRRQCRDGQHAPTGGQRRTQSRRPGRCRHVPPESARGAAVGGPGTGARPRVG